MDKPFADMIVLVTGSSGGIGTATARAFVDGGATVVGADLVPPEDPAEMANFVPYDAALEQSGKDLVQHVVREHRRIDVLVHAVGVLGEIADPLATPTDEWERVMRINASSGFTMAREVGTLMREACSGSIVLFSSVAAKEARAEYLPYNASKIALLHVTWSLAQILGPYGVNVNALCPGPVNTAMWAKKAGAEGGSGGSTAVREARARQLPMGRFAEPEEVARAAVFLAHPANRYLTGLSLDVAGGAHLGMGS